MASEYSFDIISKPDMQEVKNALQQVEREIGTRFDFKDSVSEVKLEDEKFVLHSDDEFKLEALTDVLRSKLVKRNVDLKFLDYGKIEPASKMTVRQEITLKSGLATDAAKKIAKAVKDKGLKVTTQIQDGQLRVASKSKDDLQAAITFIKGEDFEVPLQFVNYR